MNKTSMNAWDMQNELMRISDQTRPDNYEVNKTSILYSALILEEVAELLTSLHKIIINTDNATLEGIVKEFEFMKSQIHTSSLEIRNNLKFIPDFSIFPSRDEVIELADAATDIAVVNCGFTIASGINGASCYEEVVCSNLSKSNPETGIIDKDESGKWIKGSGYFAPSLEKILYPL